MTLTKNILCRCAAIAIMAAAVLPSANGAPKKVKAKYEANTFAIFVDSVTALKTAPELEAYAQSVRTPSRAVETVVVGNDISPDSLRGMISIMASRHRRPLEGMVFVGDIPIVMMQDAQHLSSAFKIDQNPKKLEQSSCPTDRFYDDLSMKANFLCRDSIKPQLYYYLLDPASPPQSHPTLYSGRIKGMDFYGRDKYENIARYLRKVVEVKSRREKLDRMLMFAGQGYNSEDILARIDEKGTLLEQLPMLALPGNNLEYMDFREDEFAKYPLMTRLQQPGLKLAMLHHHGHPNKEYIDRFPDARGVQTQLDQAKLFFRGKIRDAVEGGKPAGEVIADYCKRFNVPAEWFDSIFTPASIAADSVYYAEMDLTIDEFGKHYTPNARVVMLDACFNGAFNKPKFIAGAYIFGDGDCVATVANSVNSLQDKWSDRNIGLLGLGVPVGQIVRLNPYMESHVIGDPTFAFAAPEEVPGVADALAFPHREMWNGDDFANSPYAALRAASLALAGHTPEELLGVMRSSASPTERFHAMMLLWERGGDGLTESIALGLEDNNELVRRFAAIHAGKHGHPSLARPIARLYADDTKGKRVGFQLQNALQMFDADTLKAALQAEQPFANNVRAEKDMRVALRRVDIRQSANYYSDQLELLEKTLAPDSVISKQERRDLRAFFRHIRNNPSHTSVTQLLKWLDAMPDKELAVDLAEGLGWFDRSWRKDEIIAFMEKFVERDDLTPALRTTALRSLNRLKD